MNMKKALLSTVLISAVTFAGIGENFEKGGMWFGGGGWFSLRDLGEDNEATFSITLDQSFYLVDNFSFGFYESYHHFYDINYLSLGLSLGYTFLKDGELSQGPAHTLSLGSGFSIDLGDADNKYLTVSPKYKFEYFVTERIAPYISAGPAFSFDLNETVTTDLDLNVGLALHFPTKMRVNVRRD